MATPGSALHQATDPSGPAQWTTAATTTSGPKGYSDAAIKSDISSVHSPSQNTTLRQKILAVIWDSLDKTPEERAFVAKADWWILSYCCIAYFVKYLDQTNVSSRTGTNFLFLIPNSVILGLSWPVARPISRR